MIFVEITIFIFSLLSIIFAIKQNMWCWIFGIFSSIGFLCLFTHEKMVFQIFIQLIFIIQNIIGLFSWTKKVKTDYPQKSLTKVGKDLFITIISAIFVSLIIYNTNDYKNQLDVISTSIAILATFYLIQKQLNAWFIWMLYNVILFTIAILSNYYLVALTELILFITSIIGYLKWVKNLKYERV